MIGLFLYFAFATEEELGYDTTVERHPPSSSRIKISSGKEIVDPSKEVYFVYTAGKKRYRTIGDPIAEDGAFFLISRGIRVWRVREVDENNTVLPNAPELILKDGWFWEDTLPDSRVRANIISNLRKLDHDQPLPESRVDKIVRLTMDIMSDEDVALISGAPNLTLSHPKGATLRGRIDKLDIRRLPVDGQRSQSSSTRVDTLESPRKPHGEKKDMKRIHRRLLFQDVCQTFDECADITIFLSCAQQICIGQ